MRISDFSPFRNILSILRIELKLVRHHISPNTENDDVVRIRKSWCGYFSARAGSREKAEKIGISRILAFFQSIVSILEIVPNFSIA